uniref:Uncharacterized protein n=1 Tax=Anguilla anguilla TaxID=7936 RepID=A0A0E9U3U9_ANGAN
MGWPCREVRISQGSLKRCVFRPQWKMGSD